MSKGNPPSLNTLDPKDIQDGRIEDWLDSCFGIQGPKKYGTIQASIALHMVVGELMANYPGQTRENPDGSVWDGVALPQGVIDWTKKQRNMAQLDLAQGNLLDIACEHGAADDVIRMLVASGFDPGKFSHEVRMTPIGKCAFDGNASALRLFAQAGFDLSLPMRREHTAAIDFMDSNLLHRLMSKRGIDSEQGLEVVQVLLEAGVDPLATNMVGKTALEMAPGNIRVAMEKWLAAQQSDALEDLVGPAVEANGNAKPRI